MAVANAIEAANLHRRDDFGGYYNNKQPPRIRSPVVEQAAILGDVAPVFSFSWFA